MSPLRVTARRTIGYAHNVYATAFSVGAFLAAVAAYFAFNLAAAEGGRLSVAVVWVSSVAPILPLLAAFLGMDVWSEEYRTGRLEMMQTLPVSEADFTLGKFCGTWILSLCAIALSLVSAVILLHIHAPGCAIAVLPFVTAFFALALQSALWCAVSVAMSAVFRRAAIAACATAVLLVALPRAVWSGLMAWSAKGASAYGEMPIDAHAVDLASGVLSFGTVASYLLLTALALFVAVAVVELRRLVGRRAARQRASSVVAIALAGVLAVLAVLLALRLDVSLDVPIAERTPLSERTLGILSETRGDVTATCFLPRSDARFRAAARTLRTFSREAASRGGVRMTVRFVDPSWDLGNAARLVRSGVKPDSVVFTLGRRSVVLPLSEEFGERVCASAILRLSIPPHRRCVRWTVGHGETGFDDYGPFGMSDIARELSQDGYLNQSIDLATATRIPDDCALIVIAGARDEFSRAETARLDAYLKQGGRLLVMMNDAEVGGVSTLLAGWGINVAPVSGAMRTVSGSDAVISDFADHPVIAPLKGLSVLLERPVAFLPSAASDAASATDRIRFVPLAKAGVDCVATLAERGSDAGDDLDFRPTRVIAIGDSAFVMNAQLATQANANRDFFLNAVAYLSGTDAMTSGGVDGGRLVSGMDRAARRRFVIAHAALVPLAVCLALLAVAWRRRRRS